MRSRRNFLALTLSLILAIPMSAAMHRRAAMPPSSGTGSSSDVIGIGPMNGASVSGTVASVEGTTVTLESGGAPPISIDASGARVVTFSNLNATLADVTPGAHVSVFIAGSAAPLHAQMILVDSHPDLAVSGRVESVDTAHSTFNVLGITFTVNADTQFDAMFPTFAPVEGLSDLAVGQIVKVDAAFAASGLLASHVLVVAPMTPANMAIHGRIKSMDATGWVITDDTGRDVTIIVNDQTRIVGIPAVGAEVQVMTILDSASNYVAVMIMVIDGHDVGNFTVSGYVQAIGSDRWTVGGPPGSMIPLPISMPSMIVHVTPQTVIYANPKVGDRVTATGHRDSSGIFTATEIKLSTGGGYGMM